MRHIFDTSALLKLVDLKYHPRAQHRWPAVEAELNDSIKEAWVPELVLIELAKNTSVRYVAAKPPRREGGHEIRRTAQEIRAFAGSCRLALGWCNDLTPEGPQLTAPVGQWPLKAQLKLVPHVRSSVRAAARDSESLSNVRCTDKEGLHVAASLGDHLILSLARECKGVLVSQDKRLCGAAHNLRVPYRTIENPKPDFHEYWWNCERQNAGRCLQGIEDPTDSNQFPPCQHARPEGNH